MNQKKFCDVSVLGATVWFFIKEQRIGFHDVTGVLYWIDLGMEKDFSQMAFKEGQAVWIYVAKEIQRVVSVLYNDGEKIEDLPKMEPIVV